MKRKVLFICLIFMFCLLLTACKIERESSYSDGLIYELNSTKDGFVVKGIGEFSGSDLKIRPTYKKLPVVGINSFAFRDCRGLISVEIPSSVTSIDVSAFNGCSNLEKIVVNNNEVYDSRDNCNAIIETSTNTLIIGCKNTKIPSSVTSIGGSAFRDCSTLLSIEIPNGVMSIEAYAFSECSSLTSIEISNSVTSIGSYAFSECSSLTSIEIPNSVMSIGTHAFYRCRSLTNVEIPSSVTSIGGYAFSYCTSLTSVVIQKGLIGIRDNTFESCSSLTKVEIPNSVRIIGNYVFSDCESLSSVKIPNSVTSIGGSAFNGCSSLTNIEIPSSVTSIGDSAFNGCSSLTNIEIPSSVTSIEGSAFNGCSSLISITIPFVGQYADGTGATNFGYIFGASDYSSNYVYVPSSLKEVIITGGTNIGESAFYGCSSLTTIVIPNSVESIGGSTFNGCSNLENIVVNNNAIYDSRDNCNAIIETATNTLIIGCKNTKIPSSVTSIGGSAFNGCSSLTNIEIPNTITAIEISAFSDCSSLISITIPFVGQYADGTGATNFGYIFGASDYSSNYVYVPSSLKEVIITGGTNIGESAFYGCSSLTTIVIPNSVESIGRTVFSGCNSLTSITIPYIGQYADGAGATNFGYLFGTTSYTKHSSYVPFSVKEVIITGGTSIESGAFLECRALTTIVIPNSVESIGSLSFYGCTNLTTIEIPNSVESIGKYAFRDCTSLTIYCEVDIQPSEWDSLWNSSKCPVVWDYKNQ